MQYQVSLPFVGNLEKALDVATASLSSVGFRVDRCADRLQAIGPGMHSTKQSPLVGASHVELFQRQGALVLNATLGGVERMQRFVLLFPLGLCLFLAITLSVLFGMVFGAGGPLLPTWAALGLNGLLWLTLGPLIARAIRARSCRGIEALLRSVAAAARND